MNKAIVLAAIGCVGLSLSVAASAQSATTRCYSYGYEVQCQTTQNNRSGGYTFNQPRGRDPAQAWNDGVEQARRQRAENYMRMVLNYAAAGDCSSALSLARRSGDTEVLRTALNYCPVQ